MPGAVVRGQVSGGQMSGGRMYEGSRCPTFRANEAGSCRSCHVMLN